MELSVIQIQLHRLCDPWRNTKLIRRGVMMLNRITQ